MIAGTEALGQRMDDEFVANRQPNLGRAIVAASQESMKAVGLRQERLGGAIVHLTYGQSVYDTAHAAMQEQLGGATVVATRVESQMSVSAREPSAQDAMVTAAAPQSWPAIPMTAIVVASLILTGLFAAGILVFPRLSAGDPDERDRIGSAGLVPHEAV